MAGDGLLRPGVRVKRYQPVSCGDRWCRRLTERRGLVVPVPGMRVRPAAIVVPLGLMLAGAGAEGGPPGDGRALWQQSLAAQRLPDLHSEVRLETTTPAGDRVTLSLHALGKLAPDGVNRMLMARVTAGGAPSSARASSAS